MQRFVQVLRLLAGMDLLPARQEIDELGSGTRNDLVSQDRQCALSEDILQGMRVGARRRKAGGASGGSGSRIVDLTCGGMRLQGKGTQPSGALSPTGKPPDAFNRRTGPRI